MTIESFLGQLAGPVEDIDEEVFELFSQSQGNSSDLGFVDSNATTLTVPLCDGTEITVAQSPGLLHSPLKSGTTGAVLWRVSPLIASWLRYSENTLFVNEVLTKESTILELGCGISGLIASALAPRIGKFVCTDQHYVLKQLTLNLAENLSSRSAQGDRMVPKGQRHSGRTNVKNRSSSSSVLVGFESNIQALELDWETSSVETLSSAVGDAAIENLDLVIACDCIYNSYLINPFVMTCAAVCRARRSRPVLCLVAQQLRSDEIFQEWLTAFSREFITWRMPSSLLDAGLREGKGYAVHVGILRPVAAKMPPSGTTVGQK